MSDNSPSNGKPLDAAGEPNSISHPATDGGILESLPHTRPHRASPRRAAARTAATRATAKREPPEPPAAEPPRAKRAAAKQATSRPSTAKPAKSASRSGPARQSAGRTAKATAESIEPPAPRQGYESDDAFQLGATVHPPRGVELVESLAEVCSELANVGLKAGIRVFKDVLAPLRRP